MTSDLRSQRLPLLLVLTVSFLSTVGLLSKAVGDDEQGWLAGSMSAIGSAVQMVGPLLAGLLYQRVAPAAPYVLVVVVMVVAAVVVQRLTITAAAPGVAGAARV